MFRVRVHNQPLSEDTQKMLAKAQGFKTTIERPDAKKEDEQSSQSVKTSRRKPKQGQRDKSDLVQFADSSFDSKSTDSNEDSDDNTFELEGYDVEKLYSEAMKDLKSIE